MPLAILPHNHNYSPANKITNGSTRVCNYLHFWSPDCGPGKWFAVWWRGVGYYYPKWKFRRSFGGCSQITVEFGSLLDSQIPLTYKGVIIQKWKNEPERTLGRCKHNLGQLVAEKNRGNCSLGKTILIFQALHSVNLNLAAPTTTAAKCRQEFESVPWLLVGQMSANSTAV